MGITVKTIKNSNVVGAVGKTVYEVRRDGKLIDYCTTKGQVAAIKREQKREDIRNKRLKPFSGSWA